jgi:hypothetical protein
MIRLNPTTLVALVCALTLALPAAAFGEAPASDEYVLDAPAAGDEATGAAGGGQNDDGSGRSRGGSDSLTGIAAGSSDEGGLPILLLVLAGTAVAGTVIAITRRRRHET